MILSYKEQWPWGGPTNFEQKRLDGIKIHTIREDPHNRWHAGRKAHEAHGVRTKNYRCFKEDICRGIQSIKIIHSKPYGANNLIDIDIIIEGRERGTMRKWLPSEYEFLEQLAKNDGFNSVDDFFKWFDHDFTGKIIHFTDFRY